MENPPQDLLEGSTKVREISFAADVFPRILERLDEAINSLRYELLPVVCPDCFGRRCSNCSKLGWRHFRSVYKRPFARLEIGIRVLEIVQKDFIPHERHWIKLALETLKDLRVKREAEGTGR